MALDITQMIQLKLFYLFMNADGNYAEKETEKIDLICKQEKATKTDRDELDNFIKCFEFEIDEDNSDYVIKIIDTILNKKIEITNSLGKTISIPVSKSLFSIDIVKNDKVLQIHTLWTMINIGYADTDYSQPEKNIVEFLAGKWGVKPILLSTMIDTADTLASLTMQKEWVLSTNKTEEEKNEQIETIDKDMKKMYKDVEICIANAKLI
ncbi:MAG: hypothetical protein RR355_00855 [Oscillospiraceae bacterium]